MFSRNIVFNVLVAGFKFHGLQVSSYNVKHREKENVMFYPKVISADAILTKVHHWPQNTLNNK